MIEGLTTESAGRKLISLIDHFASIWKRQSLIGHLSLREDIRWLGLHCIWPIDRIEMVYLPSKVADQSLGWRGGAMGYTIGSNLLATALSARISWLRGERGASRGGAERYGLP